MGGQTESGEAPTHNGLWSRFFGWDAFFSFAVLGTIVPGILLACGFTMMNTDWFPHSLFLAQLCFAISGVLLVIKIVGYAINHPGGVGSRIAFAVVLSILALIFDGYFIYQIQKHKTIPTKPLPIVAKSVKLDWSPPSTISYGTPLSKSYVNALATSGGIEVDGKYDYTPSEGAVLNAGPELLRVTFTPTDLIAYKTAETSVVVTVIPVATNDSFHHQVSEQEKHDAITPSASFKQPEFCLGLPAGEFRPECYQPSGVSTSADVAFEAALAYANANNVITVLRLGPHVYPQCQQWREPKNNVSIIGTHFPRTVLKAVCFDPTGPMLLVGRSSPKTQPRQDSSQVDWCRESMSIEVNDGNVVDQNTVVGGKMTIKVHDKNSVTNNKSSCDPNSSMFKGFIEETAHDKDRIESVITAQSKDLSLKWNNLPIQDRTAKQKALDELVSKIRSAENTPSVEMDLLVQLHDMN